MSPTLIMIGRLHGWAPVFLALALLSACSYTPEGTSHAPRNLGRSGHQYEQQLLERARRQSAQGMHLEAATSWELLTLLRPESKDYVARLIDSRASIEHRSAELLRQARQAQQRGAIEEATQRYIAFLALKPKDSNVADTLRTLERERIKREVLGRTGRQNMAARSAGSKMTLPQTTGTPTLMVNERNELEHAAMLAGQGDFDDAIALLSQRLKATPTDAPAKTLLADVYYRKGLANSAANKSQAMLALEESLKLDPRHAGARQTLTQLKAQKPISGP